MPITGDVYEFTEVNVNNAPNTAGVYALYDNGTTTYIGRAQGGYTTIRTRLQSHKSGREGRCTQAATHYKRETCSNPVTREKELLQEYVNTHGKLPRCNNVMP
jgi:excinuclease UvrABC nuclease subunit